MPRKKPEKPKPRFPGGAKAEAAYFRSLGPSSLAKAMLSGPLGPPATEADCVRAASILATAVLLVGTANIVLMLEAAAYIPPRRRDRGRPKNTLGRDGFRVTKLAGYMLDAKHRFELPWQRSGMARKAAAIYLGRKRKPKDDPDPDWDAAFTRFMTAIQREMSRPAYVPPFVASSMFGFGVLPQLAQPPERIRSSAEVLVSPLQDMDADWQAVLDLVGAMKTRAVANAKK